MEETDAKVSLIPDFISNCGMARVFAYLMQPEAEMTDGGIFGYSRRAMYAHKYFYDIML